MALIIFKSTRFMNIYIYMFKQFETSESESCYLRMSSRVVSVGQFPRPLRWSFQNQEIEGDFLLNPADDCLSTTTVAKGALYAKLSTCLEAKFSPCSAQVPRYTATL